MTLSILVTILTIVIMVFLFAFSRIKMDVIYISVMIVFAVFGVLDVKQSFGGFISNAVLSIAFLGIIVAAVRKTGGMKLVTKFICGKEAKPLGILLVRITTTASVISAFVSDGVLATVIFADVAKWCRDHDINPSKIILPMCHAITIGGLGTIIGASGNLLALDLYQDMTGETVNFFSPLLIAFPCCVVFVVMVYLLRNYAPDLPDTFKSILSSNKVVIEMLVPSDSPHIGKTLSDVVDLQKEGIRKVNQNSFDDDKAQSEDAEQFILGGDRIVLYGEYEKLLSLRERLGFVSSRDFVYDTKKYKHQKRVLQRAIIPSNSSLDNKAILDTNFEKENEVTLLALMRSGETIEDSPRTIVLRAGDMLTFEGRKLSWNNLSDDLLPYGDATEIENSNKKWLAFGILAIVIVGSATGLFSLSVGSGVAVLALGWLGCISHKAAWDNVPWSQLVMIAGSKSISTAIAVSGLATIVSNFIISLCGGTGVYVPLAFLVGLSHIMAQFIPSYAVISMLVPIGITLSNSIGVAPLPFVMGILFGAMMTFLTHFTAGHVAMAMPHGNYRMKDLLAYGWPFSLAMYVCIVFFCCLFYL